ncbi:hypothetical protein J7373_15440 [Xanthomonas sp. A2111]|uniref:Nucleoside 2-deoxyribosyltransferase n=1 Tax=Xanthomonas hawaiiensis TaxID=3003247 RepID=A0ABU2HZD6_9XANT|nr:MULTISPECIES: hypothetical protein [unclassified Xanthomonas]MBO9829646.1 hypothetical protein [Xanthomonas sp. A2111]MBO9872010.1 hypothetical protein [Xanthomonas sp. D-93]MDS9991254.1 hypothetical protein [Xanthomonas sp. A2111]WNH43088.1 hypothetical protein PG878_11025 [Xanthomonas sp. A6251]
MRIYAAGWALQNPALNFFKRFLALNAIQLSGIVYPRKIPDDLDGIPVLDFEAARSELRAGDIVLDCLRPDVEHPRLGIVISEFFATLGIQIVGVPAFISGLIEQDRDDLLRFPVAGVTSTHLRGLRDEPIPQFIEDGFADLRSHQVATRLDAITRSNDWDQMLVFDQDQTSEDELHAVMAELHGYGVLQRVHVLDTPLPFLEALLALKIHAPESEVVVELAAAAAQALGPQLEFYRRSLGCLQVAEASDGVTYLSGSADAIASVLRPGQMSARAVFFMRRSILDMGTIRRASGAQPYRIMLRQPDTSPSNLIAALLN